MPRIILIILAIFTLSTVKAQFCNSPDTIYGLTSQGYVYPINVNTGGVGNAMNTYPSGLPKASNALAYNPLYNSFYFFKVNPSNGNSQRFVTFNGSSNVCQTLASCPTTNTVVKGCSSFFGLGYYCLDNNARLYYYEISTNTWTLITSSFVLGNNTSINSTLSSLSGGDIAIDSTGALWIVGSSANNYCLYRTSGMLPVGSVPSITVSEIIPPTSSTPEGSAFAGICLSNTGDILLGTVPNNNKLYKLNSNLTLSYLCHFSTSGVGNDLTSCNFIPPILPIVLYNFIARVNNDRTVLLNWSISSQSDDKIFYIENSYDGIHWYVMATQISKIKNSPVINYDYTTYPLKGKQFFRLKIESISGKVTYSDIRYIEISDRSTGNVYSILGELISTGKINYALLRRGTYIIRYGDGSVEKIYKND